MPEQEIWAHTILITKHHRQIDVVINDKVHWWGKCQSSIPIEHVSPSWFCQRKEFWNSHVEGADTINIPRWSHLYRLQKLHFHHDSRTCLSGDPTISEIHVINISWVDKVSRSTFKDDVTLINRAAWWKRLETETFHHLSQLTAIGGLAIQDLTSLRQHEKREFKFKIIKKH